MSSFHAANYPRVDGSTSAYPLQVMIACYVLDVRCGWIEEDFFTTTRRIGPLDGLTASAEVEVLFTLSHTGTHGAYMNLIEGNTDLIIVARSPSEDELMAAGRVQVELDARPVALDAFVFLVHADNPVQNLTLDQIRGIYTGKITNWVEIGGLDAEIHTYQRNPNSGSQELMEDLVMKGEAMLDSPDMILESMMGPINAIRDDPQGIGYSVYFYAANIYPDEKVRMMAISGVEPTSDTIAVGDYSLTTEVFVVVREDLTGSNLVLDLRDWMLTAEGQGVVESSGYVGVLR